MNPAATSMTGPGCRTAGRITEEPKRQFDCPASQTFASPPRSLMHPIQSVWDALSPGGRIGRGMTPTARLHLEPTKFHSAIRLHDTVLNWAQNFPLTTAV